MWDSSSFRLRQSEPGVMAMVTGSEEPKIPLIGVGRGI